jgi:hypothetical protein
MQPTAKVQLEGAPPTPSTLGLGSGAGQFMPSTRRPRRIGLLFAGGIALGVVGTAIAIVATRNNNSNSDVVVPGAGTGSDLVIDAGEVAIAGSDHPGSADPGAGKPPVGPGSAASGSDSATQTVVTPPKSGPCDTMNVEDLVSQANNQFNAGYAKSALSVMVKALGCKQDGTKYRTVEMYRLTATYACAAHDLTNARYYFAKVPKEYQTSIEQKCLQEGMNLRGP